MEGSRSLANARLFSKVPVTGGHPASGFMNMYHSVNMDSCWLLTSLDHLSCYSTNPNLAV